MFRFDCRLGLRILVALVVLSSFNSGLAQEDGEFRSGIDVTYRSEDGTKIQSVVPTIERAGKQSARSVQWEGLLFAQGTGEYQFAAFVSGEVKVTVGDRVLLQASSEKPQWISSKPTKLNFDRHPLSVTHQGNTGTLLRLYWRGPTYQWEPIGARWLFRADGAEFDESLIRGARLAKKHRCSACHSVPAESNPGPSLAGVRGNLRTNWLVKRLTDDGRQSTNAQRNMPYFGLSSDNAKAIAAYLFSNSKPPKSTPNETQGDVDRGRQMVFTVGCLACHTAAGIGSNDQVNVHGGGPLENIAAKRTPEFFGRWLTNPASVIANHRMPVFDLSKKEKADVITFLKTLNVEQDVLADERINESAATIAKGKMLFAKHRCGSCHDAKLHEARLEKTLELDTSRKGCLGEANAEHPGYHFAADQQRALVEFLAENIAPSKLEGPEAKLADNNCLACHQRGTGRGLSDVALQVTK
ncbi:MAG: mono/diheme cytochrome c family protein, partial [Pirellulaceae bacterium]